MDDDRMKFFIYWFFYYFFLFFVRMRSTQESSLSTTDSIKPSGKAFFDSLPAEEKKNFMYNK